MGKIAEKLSYFSTGERLLWCGSVGVILGTFFLFDGESYLTLCASLIGVTSLIFAAKGHPVSQMLMILFSLLYGIISWSFSYYGEMLTYLGMTMPMAFFALVSWLKHPYQGNRAQVEVDHLEKKEKRLLWVLTGVVTLLFYGILSVFGTANLLPSTLSVTTSFLAVYLTARRSPFYALAYAANDLVLIVLWVLASLEEQRYVSVVACFAAFFVNDLYGFISWRAMERRQAAEKK